MRKQPLLTLALTLSLAALTTAQAAENVVHPFILTGKAADLAKLRSTMSGMDTSDVFSESEAKVLKRLGKPDLAAAFVLKTKDLDSVDGIKKIITKHGLKIEIEENRKVTAKAADPLEAEQWALRNTGATQREFVSYHDSNWIQGVRGEDVQAPSGTKAGEGIVVAVIDTGVDVTHPDLVDRIAKVDSECKAYAEYQACLQGANTQARVACETRFQKMDTDGNGYPMDCQGWSAIGPKNRYSELHGSQFTGLKPSDIRDELSHGTHVAGIVAASINGIGIQGIAPRAKILPIQVIGENPGNQDGTVTDNERASTLTTVVARGMLYAIAAKANVVNLSLGWNGRAEGTPSSEAGAPIMREMVKLAQEKGILVVAAAGNDGTDALVFPCQYADVICVASHNADGQISRFSNYGSGVDIAAPGHNILSSIPMAIDSEIYTDRRGYDFKDGTSMAAPYVAGALAVLMSQGMSPQEARARILVGARARPFVESRMTLTGNLDIKRALEARPRPLIAPVEKGVIPTIWDRTENSVEVEFSMKNIWTDARNVSMNLRASELEARLGAFRLPVSQFKEASWKSGETKTVKFKLAVTDPRISSEIFLILDVKPENGVKQTMRIPVQVSVVLTKSLAYLPNAKSIPVVEGAVNPRAYLLTIQSMDGKAAQDYLSVERGQTEWKYQLIRETAQGYVAGALKSFPALTGQGGPRILQRVDLNFDGKSEYVLTHLVEPPRVTPTPGSTAPAQPRARVPYFRFDMVDETLAPVFESYTFKNETSVLQLEKFQWMKSGARLVPSWVDVGKVPVAERPTRFDPWNPNPTDLLEPQLYYHDPATPDGVRTLKTPAGHRVVGTMTASPAQRSQGIVPVLYSNDDLYVSTYFVGEITVQNGAQPQLKKVNMPDYNNLRPLEQVRLIGMDSKAAQIPSQAYIGASSPTSQRVTALVSDGTSYSAFDHGVEPEDNVDSVYKVIAAYLEGQASNPQGIASFSQGLYNLKYKDSTSSEVFQTSLRRYTFLASALFERSFIPAVAESAGVRVAAIQIPDGFGAYPGAEVITPMRDASGRTIGLIRPAALRIQVAPSSGCEWLSRTEPNVNEPSQAAYFCGDRFVRVPYRY